MIKILTKKQWNALTDKVEQSAPITPRDLLTIDGTTMWPIAISHDWRDDVTRITAMETYKR